MHMPVGGIVIQILIQAVTLLLSLKLIAKHEAETTYAKALMVSGGVFIGQIAVAFIASRLAAWTVLPAVIAFTAVVIIYFCWISFWKSVLVALIYIGIQLVFAIGFSITTGSNPMAMIGLPASNTPATQNQHQQDADAERDAARMKPESQKVEQPAPKPTPKQVTKPSQHMEQLPQISPELDWDAARKSLRSGGTIAGGKGFLAMINGKMVNEGDTVTAQYNGREYRWRVKSITSKDVELERLDIM